MMKRIESPVKKWPGYVLLKDPIPLVDVVRFEKAVRAGGEEKSLSEYQNELLPAIFPCVSEWHLNSAFPENVTVETFPGTPRKDSAKLIAVLVDGIVEIYKGDEETDPNA